MEIQYKEPSGSPPEGAQRRLWQQAANQFQSLDYRECTLIRTAAPIRAGYRFPTLAAHDCPELELGALGPVNGHVLAKGRPVGLWFDLAGAQADAGLVLFALWTPRKLAVERLLDARREELDNLFLALGYRLTSWGYAHEPFEVEPVKSPTRHPLASSLSLSAESWHHLRPLLIELVWRRQLDPPAPPEPILRPRLRPERPSPVEAWLLDVGYGAPWTSVGEDGDYRVLDRVGKEVAQCPDAQLCDGLAQAPELVRQLNREVAALRSGLEALAERLRSEQSSLCQALPHRYQSILRHLVRTTLDQPSTTNPTSRAHVDLILPAEPPRLQLAELQAAANEAYALGQISALPEIQSWPSSQPDDWIVRVLYPAADAQYWSGFLAGFRWRLQ